MNKQIHTFSVCVCVMYVMCVYVSGLVHAPSVRQLVAYHTLTTYTNVRNL